jgi:monothiol glutaredoxin
MLRPLRTLIRPRVATLCAPVSSLFSPAASRACFSSHPDFAPKPSGKAPAAPAAPAAPLEDRIRAVIAAHPVVLFMKGVPSQPMCGFSAQVVRVLSQYGVPVHGEDVLRDPALRQTMKDFSQWPTFPQVYIKGEFVGGCDILTQMHQAGELAGKLEGVPKAAPGVV